MLRVQTACNTTLEVSKEHMVAVNSRTTFARASTVQAGDTMFGAGGNKCTVVHVAQVALTSGVYAPYVRTALTPVPSNPPRSPLSLHCEGSNVLCDTYRQTGLPMGRGKHIAK